MIVNVSCCKLQRENMSYILIGLKKIHALLFEILKSIYIFESTNRFIYEQICIDF